MSNNQNISTQDLDILREIGNIGAGNAATALSMILNKRVWLEVPEAQLCNLTEIPERLGGSEEVRTGIFFGVKEALKGFIFFILDDADADKLHKAASMGLDIDMVSVLSEVSNIISGAYVGAIASMINDTVDITPPEIGHDMVGSLIDSIVSVLCNVGDKAVYIKTSMVIEEETIAGYYVLMLEQESLLKLLNYFKG